MRLPGLVMLTICVAPAVGLSWSNRASPDDLVEMNTDYKALRAQMALLQASGVRPLVVARLLQLLGEPGAEPEAEWAANVREKLSHENGDVDQWIQETVPKFLDLIETEGTRIIRNPSGSCPVASSILALMLTAERQFQRIGLDYSLLGLNESATEADRKNSRFNRMLSEVEARCIEEAYDMCLDAGSVQPFIALATEFVRSIEEYGLDEAAFLDLVAARMKDCGVYEYEGTTTSTITHHYEKEGKTETVIDSVLRGRLRLRFDKEPMTGITDLTAGTFTTEIGKPLEYELPKLRCHGTNGERCQLEGILNPAPGKNQAFMRIDDLLVKYETERAEIDPQATDVRAPNVIRFARYSPPLMDRELLWLVINPPLILWQEIDRNGSEGPAVHRPAYTFDPQVRDWQPHHLDAELGSVVVEKPIDENYPFNAGMGALMFENPVGRDYQGDSAHDYQYHEKALLKLIHRPQNRQGSARPEEPGPRKPAKPVAVTE